MSKPIVLVECDPGEYYLRNLAQIRDEADFRISADLEFLKENAPEADIILAIGMKPNSLRELWPLARKVRWIHSLSAGVEKMLFPELAESPVPMTNAKGVFKRSLAEFAVLGMLYFSKRVPLLLAQQRECRWEQFYVDWLPERKVSIVGYGEIEKVNRNKKEMVKLLGSANQLYLKACRGFSVQPNRNYINLIISDQT